MAFTAGTACADITPPPESIIACFPDRTDGGARPRTAEGAHDRLEARVLAMSDGAQQISLCGLDLTGIRRAELQRVRERIAQRAPQLAGPGLVLACSHTHSGPDTLYLFGGSPDDPWIDEMVEAVADAVVRAHEARVPAALSVGRASADLAHNRRVIDADGTLRMAREYEPAADGPVDRDLTLLRVEAEDGNPLAAAFHYAAHSLTLGPGNMRFSADYPGVARTVIEEALPGVTSLFLNGAAGNVHPHECMRPDRAATEAIGRALGHAVIELNEDARPVSDPSLAAASRTLEFVNRMDPSLEVPVEIGCVRIGPAVMGVVPGEYFVEFQLRFRERVDAQYATLIGYANGWPGYIPTREAYPEGGYGVDEYPDDPSELSRTCLPPGAGERILETLVELVGEIR
jgi:hypothetical protein